MELSNIKKKLSENKIFKSPIFRIIFVYILYFSRFIISGFKYYPQLDDYIQYYNYSAFHTLSENIRNLGLLSARPFSGILDITVWSKFSLKYMIFAVMIISLFYVLSAFLFKKVFEKYFKIGIFFYIIYLFLPLGIEGLYWVSASSRIAVGIFLISLGIYLFVFKYIKDNKRIYLFLSFFLQLIAFGLYETVMVLGITVFMMVLLLELIYNKKSFDKKFLKLFYTFINVLIILIIMKLNSSSSVYSSRYNFVFDYSLSEYKRKIYYLIYSVMESFFSANISLILLAILPFSRVNSFFIVVSDFLFLKEKIIILFILLILLIIFILKFLIIKNKEKKNIVKLICSILLFIAPLTPLLLSEQNHISFRMTVLSFLGMAMFLDLIFEKLTHFLNRYIKLVLILIVFIILYISGYKEVDLYKKTYEMDDLVSNIIAESVDDFNLPYIVVLNLEESYVSDKTIMYYEHIRGTTSSDWALKGHLSYTLKRNNLPDILPIYLDKNWFIDLSKEKYDYIKSIILNYDSSKSKNFVYLSEDNKRKIDIKFKKIKEDDNILIFEILDDNMNLLKKIILNENDLKVYLENF